MTTREFYRDYMCRHKFNEMFVGVGGNNYPTCSLVSDFALYNYNDTSGVQIPTNNSDFEIVEDVDHGKYVISTKDRSGSCYIGQFGWDDYNSWNGNRISISGDMKFGFSFKSPSQITESFACLGLYLQVDCFYLNSTNDIQFGNVAELGSLSAQFFETPYGGSTISSYIRAGSTANYGVNSDQIDIPFDLDGDLHLAEFIFLRSGQWSMLLDGEQLCSVEGIGEVSRFHRPTINVTLMGAEDNSHKYGIQRAWVKKYEI